MIKLELFKIQKPITTTEEKPLAFVYNTDRSKEFFLPMTKHIWNLFDGDLRIFVAAKSKGKNFDIFYNFGDLDDDIAKVMSLYFEDSDKLSDTTRKVLKAAIEAIPM